MAIALGSHLFPFRTQKLSPVAPMVLGRIRPGRVGRRRFRIGIEPPFGAALPRFVRGFQVPELARHAIVGTRVVPYSAAGGSLAGCLKVLGPHRRAVVAHQVEALVKGAPVVRGQRAPGLPRAEAAVVTRAGAALADKAQVAGGRRAQRHQSQHRGLNDRAGAVSPNTVLRERQLASG